MRGLSEIIEMNRNPQIKQNASREVSMEEFMEKCDDLQEAEDRILELEARIEFLETNLTKPSTVEPSRFAKRCAARASASAYKPVHGGYSG